MLRVKFYNDSLIPAMTYSWETWKLTKRLKTNPEMYKEQSKGQW